MSPANPSIDHRDHKTWVGWKREVFSRLPVETRLSGNINYLDGVDGKDGRPPNKAQQALHWLDWRYFVMAEGRRSGKSIGDGAESTAMLGIPNTKTWIVAPTYDLTDRCGRDHVYKWVALDEVYGPGSVKKAVWTTHERYIEMDWGAKLWGKSARHPDSLKGEQLDLAILDEAAMMHENIWNEYVRPCLTDRRGRAIFSSTPRGMSDWFHEYFERGADSQLRAKGWDSYTMKSEDNPFLSKEEIDDIRKTTPEDVFRREYEASFEHYTGLIWPEFKERMYDHGLPGRGGHVVKPDDIPVDGSNYRGIDIGWRHPTACVWGRTIPPRNDLYIYRAYLGEGRTHQEHAAEIRNLTKEPIVDTWISKDAKRRVPTRESSDGISAWDIYSEQGIYARQANDEVRDGCNLVSAYLMATLRSNPNHPKLFISKECEGLIQAMQSYIYADHPDTSMSSAPERPRKYKDDYADALRYLCSGRPCYIPASELNQYDPMIEDESVRYGYPRRKQSAVQGTVRIAGLN